MTTGLLINGGPWGQHILLPHYLARLYNLRMTSESSVLLVGLAAVGLLEGGIPEGLRLLRNLTLGHIDSETTVEDLEEGGNDDMSDIWEGFNLETIAPFLTLPSLVTFEILRLEIIHSDCTIADDVHTVLGYTPLGRDRFGYARYGNDGALMGPGCSSIKGITISNSNRYT